MDSEWLNHIRNDAGIPGRVKLVSLPVWKDSFSGLCAAPRHTVQLGPFVVQGGAPRAAWLLMVTTDADTPHGEPYVVVMHWPLCTSCRDQLMSLDLTEPLRDKG